MAPVPKPSPCAAMDFHSAGRGISGCERMASHVILGSNQIVSEPRPPALKRCVIDPPVSDLVGRGDGLLMPPSYHAGFKGCIPSPICTTGPLSAYVLGGERSWMIFTFFAVQVGPFC
jgi:hypothetical protein